MSYLNTKPLLYGINRHEVRNEIILTEDYPSQIARMLIDDEIDVGLIPVSAILRLEEWNIITDFCIGCDGPVASVGIFSQVPMTEITHVYLDYQSRTSVNLARVLLKEFWDRQVEFIDAAGEDFRNQIDGTTAGVVIGDRALEQRQHSKYVYDLGEAWKQHTGLPFVFAAWIANKQLPVDFVKKFNDANREGLGHIPDVIDENPYNIYSLTQYYNDNISYEFTPDKQAGMELFLRKIKMYKLGHIKSE